MDLSVYEQVKRALQDIDTPELNGIEGEIERRARWEGGEGHLQRGGHLVSLGSGWWE